MIPEFEGAASEYSFTIPDFVRDEDSPLFRYFLWEKMPQSDSGGSENPVKMILAYQAPWILSPRDMEQFASTTTKVLPSYEACISEGIHYNSAHKVWAKVREPRIHFRLHADSIFAALGHLQAERLQLFRSDELQPVGLWRLFRWYVA